MNEDAKFSDMLGATLTEVTGAVGEDVMRFVAVDGRAWELHHYQDCCESVSIDDITGNLADIVGSPITMADEVSNDDFPAPEYAESYTWTFYKLATVKGYVDVRWLGQSNGYYSESVDFREVTP